MLPGSETTKNGIKGLAKIANDISSSIRKKNTKERAAENPTNQVDMKEKFMNKKCGGLADLQPCDHLVCRLHSSLFPCGLVAS